VAVKEKGRWIPYYVATIEEEGTRGIGSHEGINLSSDVLSGISSYFMKFVKLMKLAIEVAEINAVARDYLEGRLKGSDF